MDRPLHFQILDSILAQIRKQVDESAAKDGLVAMGRFVEDIEKALEKVYPEAKFKGVSPNGWPEVLRKCGALDNDAKDRFMRHVRRLDEAYGHRNTKGAHSSEQSNAFPRAEVTQLLDDLVQNLPLIAAQLHPKGEAFVRAIFDVQTEAWSVERARLLYEAVMSCPGWERALPAIYGAANPPKGMQIQLRGESEAKQAWVLLTRVSERGTPDDTCPLHAVGEGLLRLLGGDALLVWVENDRKRQGNRRAKASGLPIFQVSIEHDGEKWVASWPRILAPRCERLDCLTEKSGEASDLAGLVVVILNLFGEAKQLALSAKLTQFEYSDFVLHLKLRTEDLVHDWEILRKEVGRTQYSLSAFRAVAIECVDAEVKNSTFFLSTDKPLSTSEVAAIWSDQEVGAFDPSGSEAKVLVFKRSIWGDDLLPLLLNRFAAVLVEQPDATTALELVGILPTPTSWSKLLETAKKTCEKARTRVIWPEPVPDAPGFAPARY